MLFLIIICIILAFFLILVVKAITAKAKDTVKNEVVHENVQMDPVVLHFQEMLKIKTISDLEFRDQKQFDLFKALLKDIYPQVHKKLSLTIIDNDALLYKWSGKTSDEPLVLMAHYDVVPAEESEWKHPPFNAEIHDGIIYGRGTLDTKGTVLCALETIEFLLKTDFIPQKDIYLAFGYDEETGGKGAQSIVEYFKQNGIKPGLIVDEGGAVVEGAFPGVNKPMAMVGVAEKGVTDIDLIVKGKGGHASTPPKMQAGWRLARALLRISKKPFPSHFPDATIALFKSVAPYASFGIRFLFSNLNIFKKILIAFFSSQGGELNAMCRTTTAFTMLKGSDALNVLPSTMIAHINMRISVDSNVEKSVEYLKKVINDPEVEVNVTIPGEPSPISSIKGKQFDILSKSIGEIYPEAIISPYIVMGGTDARYYAPLCNYTYRFCPFELSSEQRSSMHGMNENIPIESLKKGLEFYIRLVKNYAS